MADDMVISRRRRPARPQRKAALGNHGIVICHAQLRRSIVGLMASLPSGGEILVTEVVERLRTGWAERHWQGTRTDGTRLEMRGAPCSAFTTTALSGVGWPWRTLRVARGSTRPCSTWSAASKRAAQVYGRVPPCPLSWAHSPGPCVRSRDASVVPTTLAVAVVARRLLPVGCRAFAARSPPAGSACLVLRNDPRTVARNTVHGDWELGPGGRQCQADTTVRDG